MSNNKNEEKEKEGSFDPGCITDLQNKLLSHNYALKAFAVLLQSSDLSDFATQYPTDVSREHNYEADALRFGLLQIIDLYLAHQESIIAGYVDQYNKSDINLVRESESLIGMVDHDAFNSKDAANNALREAMEHLDIVINRNGELKEKAVELKETCMGYLKRLKT